MVCRRRGVCPASIHSKIAEPSGRGVPAAGVEQLALHGRPEGLDPGVVHAAGDPAHRAEQSGFTEPVPNTQEVHWAPRSESTIARRQDNVSSSPSSQQPWGAR